MELEFDKEMDALLRKARSGTDVAAAKGKHLDADSIAAFSEGAVPDAVRHTYTAHLADCNSCRKALSHVAVLNEPLVMKAAAGAAPQRAAAPSPLSSVPWYRALFRTPGLAAAFGVLVLLFGGVLIYLVTQRGSTSDASVAMEKNVSNANATIPYAGIDSNSNASETSAMSNTTIAANTMSNPTRSMSSNASNSTATTMTTGNEPLAGATGAGSRQAPSGNATVQPLTAAPAPVLGGTLDTGGKVAEAKPKTLTEERKNKDEDLKQIARDRAISDDRLARGDAAAKKAAGGASRSAGPLQNQIQTRQVSDLPVTRKVGGKTFHNSNGAWYDSAYHGQSTTNVRRGTDEFNKLDAGVRSIANDLGGVVVVVWKDKAYRIQ
jgi:hypothetical protein